VPIVHDTLSHGLASTASSLNSRHPLESRVKNWNAQQDDLRIEMARRLGGIGEVIRIGTERMAVSEVLEQAFQNDFELTTGFSACCSWWAI
jgi:hypothetical protein